jgi:hypothetical protein
MDCAGAEQQSLPGGLCCAPRQRECLFSPPGSLFHALAWR